MPEPTQAYSRHLSPLLRYLLIAGVIAFVSALYPDNATFKYNFLKGQTWNYPDLYAPFDFAIMKSAGEIEAEKTLIRQSVAPYYEWQARIGQQQVAAFRQQFPKELEAALGNPQFEDLAARPDVYERFATDFLQRVYQRGIISLHPEHRQAPGNFVVDILRGNTASKKTLESVPSPETVLEGIDDTLLLSRLPEAEFLLPILPQYVRPNLFYNDSLTQKLINTRLGRIARSAGLVKKGELIVVSGSTITEDINQKLLSFKQKYEAEVTESNNALGVRIGYVLLSTLVILMLVAYLYIYARDVFESTLQLAFLLLWVLVYAYLVYLVEGQDILSVYVLPFAIVPIIVKNFYNDRLALFLHIAIVLITSFLYGLNYQFAFLHVLAGMVAVFSTTQTREWSRFFLSLLFIFLTYALAYLGLKLVVSGSLADVDVNMYIWLFFNVFLSLLAYPLIPLLERVFGFTSSITLVELSDMNRPLLKELSIKAPGTFQHSIQVANLAEAAAQDVGANPLLVKVAALYHDIGKTLRPEFFIENQNGENPHKDLDDLQSAQIIIQHVSEGAKLAKKYRLPKILIEFIQSHHGTTRVEYFYRMHLDKHPDAPESDERLFRYPGPRPRSKEEAIVMMADSLEAASKALKEPKEKDINELVDKIVAGKIAQGQFDEARLTFEELERCKRVFKKMLKSIRHVRIEYPS